MTEVVHVRWAVEVGWCLMHRLPPAHSPHNPCGATMPHPPKLPPDARHGVSAILELCHLEVVHVGGTVMPWVVVGGGVGGSGAANPQVPPAGGAWSELSAEDEWGSSSRAGRIGAE